MRLQKQVFIHIRLSRAYLALAMLSCCCRRRQEKSEGEERERIRKVTRRYISAIIAAHVADTPGPIPIKFGGPVAPDDVIKISNF